MAPPPARLTSRKTRINSRLNATLGRALEIREKEICRERTASLPNGRPPNLEPQPLSAPQHPEEEGDYRALRLRIAPAGPSRPEFSRPRAV